MPWWHSNWRSGRRKPESTPRRRDGTRLRRSDSEGRSGKPRRRLRWRACARRVRRLRNLPSRTKVKKSPKRRLRTPRKSRRPKYLVPRSRRAAPAYPNRAANGQARVSPRPPWTKVRLKLPLERTIPRRHRLRNLRMPQRKRPSQRGRSRGGAEDAAAETGVEAPPRPPGQRPRRRHRNPLSLGLHHGRTKLHRRKRSSQRHLRTKRQRRRA